MVNVMGDALATGIMAHICRKDFVKEGEQVRSESFRYVLCRSRISVLSTNDYYIQCANYRSAVQDSGLYCYQQYHQCFLIKGYGLGPVPSLYRIGFFVIIIPL